MLVFSGSSNLSLAKKLAKELKLSLGQLELSRFANDESRVWVKEKNAGEEAIVVQSLSQPTDHHLVEFCLIVDALRRRGVKKIIAVIPWLGYSKQDKVFRPGEPLSAAVIARIVQLFPLKRIITFDLHHSSIRKFFRVPLTNLTARELLMEDFKKRLTRETVIVAPDAGAIKSAQELAKQLKLGVVYISKERDLNTGRISIQRIKGEVKAKKAIIIDDMLVTGDTLIKTANLLTKNGVQSIEVGVTHHLYVPGAQKKIDNSPISRLLVTDTIEPKIRSSKLKVLSVAGIIAKELRQTGA
jgi:ribose-phosphate pyrophosphokinase